LLTTFFIFCDIIIISTEAVEIKLSEATIMLTEQIKAIIAAFENADTESITITIGEQQLELNVEHAEVFNELSTCFSAIETIVTAL